MEQDPSVPPVFRERLHRYSGVCIARCHQPSDFPKEGQQNESKPYPQLYLCCEDDSIPSPAANHRISHRTSHSTTSGTSIYSCPQSAA